MTEDLLPGCRLHSLKVRGDDRGSLIAIEGDSDLAFAIARVYYVFGTNMGVDRGKHAHYNLKQLAIAVAGSCTMVLDDGHQRIEVLLNDPAVGLTMGPMIWREMTKFSSDCVLLVLANEIYDEDDYIRDYETFRAAVASKVRTDETELRGEV